MTLRQQHPAAHCKWYFHVDLFHLSTDRAWDAFQPGPPMYLNRPVKNDMQGHTINK